jgi:hypothetical protein
VSESDDKKNDAEDQFSEFLFTELILSFQAATWQQMGKVPSIVSGKLERNLEMAKHSIDMLGMLEGKTKGHLTEDESKILEHVLFELRLNYLDELRKGPETGEQKKEEAPQASEQPDNATQNEK